MISLVSTIYNDRAGLEVFFSAMAKQTRVPDEIVITDAGSRDGTWELMQAEAARTDRPWKFRALQEARCNCARGRNLAIEQASHEIIVSTDIGCEWDAEWLAELAAPLLADSEVELVNGSWAVKREELHGVWAQVEWALKGDQRLEANANSFSSSRSIAYRKNTWKALGRYPEDLTLSADDAVFQCLLRKAEVRRMGAPKVRCYWHRHESLKGFFKEAYRYGVGGGEAGIEGKDVAMIGGRMAMEAACLVFGLAGLWPAVPFAPWIGITLLAVAAGSVLGKIIKMKKAIGRLRADGVSHPLLRLLVFNYGTKWHWLRGHAAGQRRGRTHCRECRRRLYEMSPAFYRGGITIPSSKSKASL